MTKMPLVSELRANLTFLGRRGTVGSASQSEAMTVAVGFSPRGGSAKPGVAERRLKGSIGSLVQASLRDAQRYPPLSRGLKPTATIMQSRRDCPESEIRPGSSSNSARARTNACSPCVRHSFSFPPVLCDLLRPEKPPFPGSLFQK